MDVGSRTTTLSETEVCRSLKEPVLEAEARVPTTPNRRPSLALLPRRRQTFHSPAVSAGGADPTAPEAVLSTPRPQASVAASASALAPAWKQPELTEALRQEIALAVGQERRARRSEVAELYALLQGVQDRLPAQTEIQVQAPQAPAQAQAQSHLPGCCSNASTKEQAWNPTAEAAQRDLSVLHRELQAEREARCERSGELHARITRELAEVACIIEQQRLQLSEEITSAHRKMEEERNLLERRFGRERKEQEQELQELRAILEAIWRKVLADPGESPAASPPQQRLFAYPEGDTKEFVGDPEDIFTLYDMVREALSDSMHLQKQISDEQEERQAAMNALARHLERTEVRLNTLQMIVQLGNGGGTDSSCGRRTISSLVAEDPVWRRLLQDPDRLFSADDIIDREYRKYLSDVLALMVRHDCGFRRAVELSTALAAADTARTEAGTQPRPATASAVDTATVEEGPQTRPVAVSTVLPPPASVSAVAPSRESAATAPSASDRAPVATAETSAERETSTVGSGAVAAATAAVASVSSLPAAAAAAASANDVLASFEAVEAPEPAPMAGPADTGRREA